MTSRIFLLSLASIPPCLAGEAKNASVAKGNWEFSWAVGPSYRQAGTMSFRGDSRSADLSLPSFVGEHSLVVPPIGEVNAIGDRQYDDGFVRVDDSTAIDGYTTYWGYQNSSQVSSDNLNFHATGFESIRNDQLVLGTHPKGHEQERGIAPVLQFDARHASEIAGIRPGFNVSLSWMPVALDRSWRDFSLTQTRDDYRHDWTDTYNLGGFGDFIPSAPYSGSPDAPGFTLENLPDSRGFQSVLIGSESALISNAVVTRFRADHSTLSFGPTFRHEIDRSWWMDVGGGISLQWLHWSASQRESLTLFDTSGESSLARWTDGKSGDKLLVGLYFQAGVEWQAPGQFWGVKGFLRRDAGNRFSTRVGPSEITYEPDGYTAAVMLSRKL
jgi:hypothetical protein